MQSYLRRTALLCALQSVVELAEDGATEKSDKDGAGGTGNSEQWAAAPSFLCSQYHVRHSEPSRTIQNTKRYIEE
jgi:hypothetical protein